MSLSLLLLLLHHLLLSPLGADVEVKLVDFEFSYLFTQPFKECDGHYGTYGYISPECWDAWYGDASLEEQKQVRMPHLPSRCSAQFFFSSYLLTL